jgi:hypothetical protein
MDDNNTIEMLRLNPNQDPGDKTLKQNLLPSMETDLENPVQTSNLKMFLGINATTDEGINVVEKRYGLENKWRDTIKESKEDDRATKYYKLLVLVKTTSKKDNVWISFVEGLHRHAAIVMCLTCSDFDLKDNYIDQGSLKNKAFKNAAGTETLRGCQFKYSMTSLTMTMKLLCCRHVSWLRY